MTEQNNELTEMERLAEEQAQDLAQAELEAQEQAQRDAIAAQMEKELKNEESDSEPDFDPGAAFEQMTPEQEQAAISATQDLLETSEGAEFAAQGAIDYYEELLQEHGHERFKISDKKKQIGVKRLSPVIQKYAPQMLGLLGSYKNEIMAALWAGSLAYSSVKQIKALKTEDAKAEKAKHEQEKEQQEAV